MILHGNSRGGGGQLARHLTNVVDNEQVIIHELRGFTATDLNGAFKEAQAIALGTKCKKFLYSLSLNPPRAEIVNTETFENAINEAEQALGLEGQSRAVVFHIKDARLHAHVVWHKIDVQDMKAIDISYDKLKLRSLSKSLYLTNGWKIPKGLMDYQERDPLNFSHAEYQQAIRMKMDTRSIKKLFQECWAASDNRETFANALAERGYYLANGRRGFVAIDWRGEILPVSRYVDVRQKELRAKLGDPKHLPNVEAVSKKLANKFTGQLNTYADQLVAEHQTSTDNLKLKKDALITEHRKQREELEKSQRERRRIENKKRLSRLPTGLKALWFRVTGKYRKIKTENELEAKQCDHRDRQEIDVLSQKQLEQSQRIHREVKQLRHHHVSEMHRLNREISAYVSMSNPPQQRTIDEILKPTTRKQHHRRPSKVHGWFR